MSNVLHPAKNESTILVTSESGVTFANSLSTKVFNTDGWSTIILNEREPCLCVLLYVYTGSGLPKNSLVFHLTETDSSTFKSYGGNHIIRPPLGPFSQGGKSCCIDDVLHDKFSNDNIYFLT